MPDIFAITSMWESGMGEAGDGEKAKSEARISHGRSPAYPYIDLEKAIYRATQIKMAGAARQAMPPETFYQIWKLGPQSSGARQTMAALNHFGLADYQARGGDRKVKLSDLALKIILDAQEISPERDSAIRQAALNPTIHKELFEKYGNILPADVVIQTYLVRDRNYNEQAAKSLIGEYKDTLNFAGLDRIESIPDPKYDPPVDDRVIEPAKVGDFIQWTNQGVDQFAVPRQVQEVSPDAKWLIVEGSNTGIPMNEIQIVDRPPPKILSEPPLDWLSEIARRNKDHRTTQPAAETREERFSLSEGSVIITYPLKLSIESVEDLEAYLQIFLKKARREASS